MDDGNPEETDTLIALRALERRWRSDLSTLDRLGLHIAAARLDGALHNVRQSLPDTTPEN